MKWEYHIELGKQICENDSFLKEMGEDGWEMIVARSHPSFNPYWDLIFKRPAPPEDNGQCFYCSAKRAGESPFCESHQRVVDELSKPKEA